MSDTASILLAWEANELNSWNPILADLLREAGDSVTEVHDVDGSNASTSRSSTSAFPASAWVRPT